MRIVLINWAPIAAGASLGGGVNGYCQGLAAGLAARGHDVSYLSAGTRHTPDGWKPKPGDCEARRMPDFQGVRVFDVVNSPTLAPGVLQFADPLAEVSAPALDRELARLFSLLKPEVVHFHNIEGFAASSVAVARAAGARVFISLHNYYTVCPQVYLMQGGRRPCFSFDSGRACVGCIPAPIPADYVREKLEAVIKEKAPRMQDAPWRVRLPVLRAVLQDLKSLVRPIGQAPETPGRPVATEADALRPDPPAAHREHEVWPEELTPLVNDPCPDPPDGGPLNEYARRRLAMIGALNTCDRVVAVSSFVARKFEALGVRADRLLTLPIGSRMPEIVNARPGILVDPPSFDAGAPRPIRAVFIGYHNYFKGLHMLLDTLDDLPGAVLSRFHLAVHAKDVEPIEHRLLDLEPRLAGLTLSRGYRYEDIPRLLSGRDLGLVPSVWWDNGPQTVMEFFACRVPVLGAAVGGIPDLVRHGHNGLLFRGNDRADLARALSGIASDPSVLDRLRSNIDPPKDMATHTTEIEHLYAGDAVLGEPKPFAPGQDLSPSAARAGAA